jgi:hypothetical protein
MSYAVLMAGHTTTELEAEYGDFGDMAIDLLRGDHCETWTKFNVCDGAFPTERELSSFQVSTSSCEQFAMDAFLTLVVDKISLQQTYHL